MRPVALLLTLLAVAVAVAGLGPGVASAATSAPFASDACMGGGGLRSVGSTRVAEDAIPIENDADCDERANAEDNCPGARNYDQLDTDGDRFGDACDDDDDADGVPDASDNCRVVANPGQEDATPGDGMGDACIIDTDGDGIVDPRDNCPRSANPGQLDTDRDTYGDACDGDDDDDYRLDITDNCPLAANPDQADADGDGTGNACDDAGGVITAPPGPAGGGNGGGGGAPADGTPPAIRVTASRNQRPQDAAGGMPVAVRCSEACVVVAEVSLSGRDARRLGLARTAARRVVVARGDAALGGRGTTWVFFDLTRDAQRRLFRARAVRATMTLRVTDAANNAATARRVVTFRR